MISIIIPTLNEASVIEKTLKLLRQAQKTELEIIVSDGGSKDGTVNIAKQYADKVIVYDGAKRQTIAMAKNSGERQASGKLLLFIDADVAILKPDDFFDEAEKVFATDENITACTVRLKVLPELATLSDRFFFAMVNFAHFAMNNVLRIGAASGECQLVRREVFEKLDGYREDLPAAEDQEFFRRLGRAGKTRFLSRLTVYHTGRRARQIGWPKLLWLWFMNGIFVPLFGRSWSKVWKEIR